jgi:hypothetical protein
MRVVLSCGGFIVLGWTGLWWVHCAGLEWVHCIRLDWFVSGRCRFLDCLGLEKLDWIRFDRVRLCLNFWAKLI